MKIFYKKSDIVYDEFGNPDPGHSQFLIWVDGDSSTVSHGHLNPRQQLLKFLDTQIGFGVDEVSSGSFEFWKSDLSDRVSDNEVISKLKSFGLIENK
ncbi:hypothetical protein COB55_05555 [Candidatus Wolfebacteria bacterium]|nr:MAG: hypothetical protein COB55_05555 [Candidatus Wolfebacteria bacterium]